MSDTDKTALEALREKFPPTAYGKLPKGGVMIDYVGHAAVTDRLLSVDPLWSWEPFAVDGHGLPAVDGDGNLWIRLTVCGVTRIGVGDGATAKIRIGDALRNAAMRFGVALDLWSKAELESVPPVQHTAPQAPPPLAAAKARVWQLTAHKGDDRARQAYIAAALDARGSSIANATVTDLHSLADEWEKAATQPGPAWEGHSHSSSDHQEEIQS